MGRKSEMRIFNELLDQLDTAVGKGDLEEVKRLVSLGADIKERWGAISSAIRFGHTEIVKYLVSAGASLGNYLFVQDSLKRAAADGHIDVIKLVVSIIVDAELTTQDVNYPVRKQNCVNIMNAIATSAVTNGHLEIVKFIVSAGAEISELCKSWVIQLTSAHGQLDSVKYLVSLGADITTPDDHGNYPVKCSAQNGEAEIVRYLIASGGLYEEDDIFDLMKNLQKTCRSREETLTLIDMMIVGTE